VVLDRYIQISGSVARAIYHHRPERIARLTVRDEDDSDLFVG
jgi:hypothetical protein